VLGCFYSLNLSTLASFSSIDRQFIASMVARHKRALAEQLEALFFSQKGCAIGHFGKGKPP
jgi:hypothetical protein